MRAALLRSLFTFAFFPHSFLFPGRTKQRGNGGDAERGGGGWGGRAASVVSAVRGASSAASGAVEGRRRRILGAGALSGSLRRAGAGGAGLPVPGARPGGSEARPFLPRRPPGETWRGMGSVPLTCLGVPGVPSRIRRVGLWPSRRNKPLTSSACQDFQERHLEIAV